MPEDDRILLAVALVLGTMVLGLVGAVLVMVIQKYRTDIDKTTPFWQGESRFHEFNYLNPNNYAKEGVRVLYAIYVISLWIILFFAVILPRILGV